MRAAREAASSGRGRRAGSRHRRRGGEEQGGDRRECSAGEGDDEHRGAPRREVRDDTAEHASTHPADGRPRDVEPSHPRHPPGRDVLRHPCQGGRRDGRHCRALDSAGEEHEGEGRGKCRHHPGDDGACQSQHHRPPAAHPFRQACQRQDGDGDAEGGGRDEQARSRRTHVELGGDEGEQRLDDVDHRECRDARRAEGEQRPAVLRVLRTQAGDGLRGVHRPTVERPSPRGPRAGVGARN